MVGGLGRMYLQSCLLSVSTHGKIPTSRGLFVCADSQQIRMLLSCVNVNKQTLGKEELDGDVKRTFVAPGIGSARIAAQACPLPPLIVSAAPTSLAHALDRTANTTAANVTTPLRLHQDKKAKTACNELQVDYILRAKADPTSETLPCFHTRWKLY